MSFDLQLSTTWHDASRRKLEAARACQERDLEALIDLTNTFISYRGRKGIQTSDNTRAYYEIAIRDWVNHCWPDPEASPDVPLLRATRDDVERYLALIQRQGGHLGNSQDKPLLPGSAAAYLAGIRTFYKALVWAAALKESPAHEVRTPSDPRPRHERRPALPLEEYRRLVDLIDKTDAVGRRNLLILRLMGDQGLRISEVVHLKTSDIDRSAGLIHIRNGKGGKSRTIPLTTATAKALTSWLRDRPLHAVATEDALLVNVGKKVKLERRGRAMHANTVRLQLEKLYKQAGVSERYRGAHVLRHTAGTRLYRNTRDLYRVAQILGHSDVNTSSIYAKMDIDGLKEAIASLDQDDID